MCWLQKPSGTQWYKKKDLKEIVCHCGMKERAFRLHNLKDFLLSPALLEPPAWSRKIWAHQPKLQNVLIWHQFKHTTVKKRKEKNMRKRSKLYWQMKSYVVDSLYLSPSVLCVFSILPWMMELGFLVSFAKKLFLRIESVVPAENIVPMALKTFCTLERGWIL